MEANIINISVRMSLTGVLQWPAVTSEFIVYKSMLLVGKEPETSSETDEDGSLWRNRQNRLVYENSELVMLGVNRIG
jgi:hypothetical protein